MQAEYIRKCSLCLVSEKEVAPFVQELKKSHPHVEMAIFPGPGTVQIMFQSETPVDALVALVQKKFSSFFYGEGRIEEAVHKEFIAKKATLALAESCTGGKIAATLSAIPGCSKYFLGSIVAYSNAWKERFLQVSRSTLDKQGAVSREVVIEMVRGLFSETDADYGVAVSGIAGPSGGTKEKPVGTIFIAIGQRGHHIDAGVIHAPPERSSSIDLSVHLTLGALWRRLVHNTATFS
jgi:PncC family amidohydrolase